MNAVMYKYNATTACGRPNKCPLLSNYRNYFRLSCRLLNFGRGYSLIFAFRAGFFSLVYALLQGLAFALDTVSFGRADFTVILCLDLV